MKIISNYNFKQEDIADRNYRELFERRRRDSVFALAFEEDDGSVVLIRDHLGSVPLFYRIEDGKVLCSTIFSELVKEGDVVDSEGLRIFIAFGTVKIQSFVKGVKTVPPGTALRVLRDGTEEVLYTYHFNTDVKVPRSFEKSVDKLDELMLQAVKRVLVNDEVGVYLSGGIDSALLGLYIKKAGAKIRAYTSLPWGASGTEAKYAKINAEKISVPPSEHFLVPLRTEVYEKLISRSHGIYGSPHGISSQLGIMSLWSETPIARERQIFFGQNADTMTCSMIFQYMAYFFGYLSPNIRSFLDSRLGTGTYVDDYISLVSRGHVRRVDLLSSDRLSGYSRIEALTVAGMLVAHSAGDGEGFSLPILKNGALFSNPYLDIDIVEFCLSQPIRNRLALSRQSKIFVSFEKKLMRSLALRYLPKELVFRKKGLTVPMTRDQNSRDFYNSLPKKINGFVLEDTEGRLAARVVEDFMKSHSLRFEIK